MYDIGYELARNFKVEKIMNKPVKKAELSVKNTYMSTRKKVVFL